MSSLRSTRRSTTSTNTDTSFLSTLQPIECLLLAQAVWELGANSWQAVSKLLVKHPLLMRPKSFYTPQSCLAIYNYLMKEAGLECTDTNAIHAPPHLKLAQKYYQARVLELRDLIANEEAKFKTLVSEIEEIRAGKWDSKIKTAGDTPPTRCEGWEGPQTQDASVSDHTGVDGFEDMQEVTKVDSVMQEHEERRPVSFVDASMDTIVQAENGQRHEQKQPEVADSPPFDQPPEGYGTGQGQTKEQFNSIHRLSPALTVKARQGSGPSALPEEAVAVPQKAEDEEKEPRQAGKRKASFTEAAECLRDKKRARDESEPVEEEDQAIVAVSGPARRRRPQTEEQIASKRFQNVIGMLLSQISQHRNGNIFHNPIKNSEAPDYREIVKRPMDLKTIKGRIKDGVISNSLEFQRDICLMFANAMMFNRPGSDVYAMAEEMMLESEDNIYTFRQTEGLVRGTQSQRHS